MKFYKTIILCLVISACDLFSSTYWEEDNYYIQNDSGSAFGKSLYYDLGDGNGIGRVEFVTKIGSGEKYLIIESQQKTENKKDYWILDKTKDHRLFNASEIVEGPYTESDFLNKKSEYGIENLKFTQEF